MKNMYHLAIEFYNLDEFDEKLKFGKVVSFIDFGGVLRTGTIIDRIKPMGYPEDVEYYHDFVIECQSLNNGANFKRKVPIDYIIKEGQQPQQTVIKLATKDKLEFPLRT